MNRESIESARRDRREGSILIVVIALVVVVGFLVGGAVITAHSHARAAANTIAQADALSLAEGVTESAQKQVLDLVSNFQPAPTGGSVEIGGTTYPFKVEPIGAPILRTDSDGVQLAIQPYQIEASVDTTNGAATVTRIVDLTVTPIFQYMIFYADDLELLPGPSMTLGGRVHANGDLYVGSGATLTVDSDYFRCTGRILRERKNDGSTTGGNIDVREFEDTNFEEMENWRDSNHSDWTTMALDRWGGTVQDGAHDVSEVAAPAIGSIKAFDGLGNRGYYHENADLVIIDNVAFDTNGVPVALPPGVISETSFYDAREEEYVRVTEVDIAALNASGRFPANGLIYTYRTDSSTAVPNGTRLKNGSELAGALTVVSEGPVYVQGDYNTVDKKGASVISDAVNLLSNAWDDTKAPGSVPAAVATQFNLAMVTGNVPTPDGGGDYSGGFENLPRFHEAWSGVSCTIRGSFVNMYESEVAVERWGKSGVYSAPIRDWQYDPDLLSPGGQPPFTPNAVYFRRVVWMDNLESPLP